MVLPAVESRRLDALRRLQLLDVVEPDPRFHLMALVAQQWFDVPMVSITLVDQDRQWRLAWYGDLDQEGPIAGAICPVAMHASGAFVVPDTTRDPRFADSPYVGAGPRIRFYAGWPLRAPSGYRVGAFCVMDTRPRCLSFAEQEILADLGRWVEGEIRHGAGPAPRPQG